MYFNVAFYMGVVIQCTFIECLLCAKHSVRFWGQSHIQSTACNTLSLSSVDQCRKKGLNVQLWWRWGTGCYEHAESEREFRMELVHNSVSGTHACVGVWVRCVCMCKGVRERQLNYLLWGKAGEKTERNEMPWWPSFQSCFYAKQVFLFSLHKMGIVF